MSSHPVAGQFDDAELEHDVLVQSSARVPGEAYVDEAENVEWTEDEEDDSSLASDDEEFGMDAVNDEDWESAQRDFTKQYNRLRQHVAVRTGNATGAPSSVANNPSSVATVPAVNLPRTSNASLPSDNGKKTSDQLAALSSKYAPRLSKISLPYAIGVGVNRKGPSEKANMKDKADRATSEQVLDPRTRIILFKMIGRGLIWEVNGCVSTGKEANVYHATSPSQPPVHLALKIYKTSILIFKDRDRYVTGEHRFRHGYSRRNPRKMVKLWAEKEMRNLKRLHVAGVRCPEPIEVRENVLVIAFLGNEEGWASPRLKDADIPPEASEELYVEMVVAMRRMYHDCHLVHADLSEYNVLYHQSHLYVIDVSQSVEHDHPHAFDFLRSDIKNVDDFFSKLGARTLGLRKTFEFVTRDHLSARPCADHADNDETLSSLVRHEIGTEAEKDAAPAEVPEGVAPSTSRDNVSAATAAQNDAVFLRSYIPRTLNEVYDPERDVDRIQKGEGGDLIYGDLTGVVAINDGVKKVEVSDEEESSEDASDDDAEPKNVECEEHFQDRAPRGKRHEDRDAKKDRKKAAKEEAREKRKHKLPKAEKKRRIKATKS